MVLFSAELDWDRGLCPPFGGRSDEHRKAELSDERLCLERDVSNDSPVRPGASRGRRSAVRNSHIPLFEKAICHVIIIASGAGVPSSS
jgi:hypothetical protein